jgi:glyoxylate/hydroxypyruvate reductase A
VEADILAALDAGDLYAASLDVFETEPLQQSSPLWNHPRVVITPHNAAESETNAIVRYMLRQVRAHMSGQPLENLVDPARGY